MDINTLQKVIENAWENFDSCNKNELELTINEVFNKINSGEIRVAHLDENSNSVVNQWIKKAILLKFKTTKSKKINEIWFDKIDLKFKNWSEDDFIKANIRSVPGAFVREGSFISPTAILMPCFINVGAYIGEGTMIDTWSTVGSCAQIGKNCHISGGVGIGGVLEPLQANPVIIGDNCFIGARSEIAEGVIVENNSVISMGVYIGASTKIINRATGEVIYGRIPSGSVVVSGSIPSSGGVNLYAAIIVKQVDERTRSKTLINELLRD